MRTPTLDDLESEYGTDILAGLCGQSLTRNQQPVRLFDQTRNTAEVYYRSDPQGKPYIQDYQNGKRYYPVTAYAKYYKLEFSTANWELIRHYYGKVTVNRKERRTPVPSNLTSPSRVDFIPADAYQRCQTHFERNGLYEYIRFTYGSEKAQDVFTRYRLGTSRRWQHLGYLATCLPQFDNKGNLRQVKIMPFDAMNGRRIKKHQPAEQWNPKLSQYEPTEPDTDKTYFAGKQLAKDAGIKNGSLKQCFFGEHLLSEYPDKIVALVEGESTAIVCSIKWPQFIWLATGGSTGAGWANPEIFKVLRGRKVTLWPDTGKYQQWKERAETLRSLVTSLNVSDYVDKNAPAGANNIDLRDLLSRPCYVSTVENKIIYGEVLSVELSDSYPSDWDAPPSPTPNVAISQAAF